MTTPAISINTRVIKTGEGKRSRYNAAGVLVDTRAYHMNYYQQFTWRERAASSSSPVRPDGSRAPKAWDHRWGQLNDVAGKYVIKGPYWAGPTQTVVVEGYAGFGLGRPAFAVVNSLLSQVGLLWLNGNNVSEFPPLTVAAATTKVRNKALDGVAELGVTMAELHKTAGFVKDVATGMVKTLDRLSSPKFWGRGLSGKQRSRRTRELLARGRSERRKRHESAAAYAKRLKREKQILQDWLTFQFAVKPLVYDVQDAGAALSYWLFERGNPLRVTYKAGHTDEWQVSASFGFSINMYTNRAVTTRSKYVAQASCHFSLLFEVQPGTDRTIQQLGLNNPYSVAWELVQFSWMVDYVLGVGDWIKSMAKLDGLSFVEGCRSELLKLRSEGSRPDVQVASASSTSVKGAVFLECGRFKRTVLAGPPGPALLPLFRNKMGIGQLANTLSALAVRARPTARI